MMAARKAFILSPRSCTVDMQAWNMTVGTPLEPAPCIFDKPLEPAMCGCVGQPLAARRIFSFTFFLHSEERWPHIDAGQECT